MTYYVALFQQRNIRRLFKTRNVFARAQQTQTTTYQLEQQNAIRELRTVGQMHLRFGSCPLKLRKSSGYNPAAFGLLIEG
ncbi:DUF2968 domain-containing protein [Caballeronia pedi]|uniref:DUF2968 domain-containing protein n=1 Tax=Caballeronia pedi TaxID=1777141 RepID=UPI000AC59F8D|nr:DUF2968 domain-containing protein [Caballeronia pedi]